MVKSGLNISALALSAVLLLTVPTVSESKEKIVIDLKPKTGWTATMIDGASAADGYCALTRKYDQGLVLTLGQSVRDEYSLAIDFQGQKLNTEKAYKITLQPGPGEIRAYEMMPASSQAMVVRLGYDQGFMASLQKSKQLKVSIDGKNYQFTADNMDKGKTKLEQCMAGLKGDDAVKTASNFSAEKIKNSEFVVDPIKVVKKEAVKIVPKKIELAPVEAPVKKALSIPAPEKLSTIKKKVEPAVEAIVTPEPIIEPAKKEVIKAAKAKVKKPIQISRVDSKSVKSKPIMPAVEAPKVETAPMVKKVVKQPDIKAIVTPAPIIEPAKKEIIEVVKAKPEVKKQDDKTQVSLASMAEQKISARPKSMAAEGKKYGSAVRIVEKKADKLDRVSAIKPIVETAKVEAVKQEAKPEVKKIEVKKDEPKAVEIKLTDNDILDEKKFPKPFSTPVEKKTEAKQPEKEVVKPSKVEAPRPPEVSPEKIAAEQESKKELSDVRAQLNALEKENHQLYQDAKKARGDVDTAVAKTSGQALTKMLSYEKKLEAANADNLSLSREIEELRRVKEDTQVSALSGDPAAQQSMRRYNEAEREIKRLGLLLEQQRLSHRQEKVELEELLFDPAVTDQAQRRKLTDLENRLADAEKRFQVESKKVNKVDVVTQNKLQALEGKLAEANKREARLVAEEQRVKVEAKKFVAAELKLAELAQKEQTLKVKEQRLLMDAKKLSTAEATLAQARIKEQEIKAAEQRLRVEAQKLSATEAKLAQVQVKEQQILAAEQALRAKTQKIAMAEANIASAQAKFVEVNRKQAQAAAAKRRISTQRKEAAVYSRERIAPKSPVRVPTPSFGRGNIQGLLNQSGLSSVSNVVQQSSGRYSWNAAGMSGKAEVVLNSNRQSLSQFSQRYIAREKQKCRGDFASLASTVPSGKQGYEVACVGATGGKSASVVFVQKGQDLIAIAHETTANNMDAAIDARDKIAGKL